jgi:hypothetical protein
MQRGLLVGPAAFMERLSTVSIQLKSHAFVFLILLSGVGGCDTPALAEIRKCNGVWTNKPCDSPEEQRLPEKHRTPRPQSEIDLDRKKLLI